MPIYLPSGGAITQAAILAALSTDPVFEGGATFAGDVTLTAGKALQITDTVGGEKMRFVNGVFSYVSADGTTYQDFELYANSFYFGVGSGGGTDGMMLNDDGSAEFYAGIILPTADPGIAGAWWDNAGTLTKSSGP